IHNNSTNFTTGFAPNELVYKFKVNNNFALLEDLLAEDYEKLRKIKRDAAKNAIAFALAVTKTKYNLKHSFFNLDVGDKVYFNLHY
ncbi:MAG: hypothetical protein Q9164_007677, partial [Protoblastenia rupestris]